MLDNKHVSCVFVVFYFQTNSVNENKKFKKISTTQLNLTEGKIKKRERKKKQSKK